MLSFLSPHSVHLSKLRISLLSLVFTVVDIVLCLLFVVISFPDTPRQTEIKH